MPAGGLVVVPRRARAGERARAEKRGKSQHGELTARLPTLKAIPPAYAGEPQFVLIITPAKNVASPASHAAAPHRATVRYNYCEVLTRARVREEPLKLIR